MLNPKDIVTAKPWKLWLAKRLGKRVEANDDGATLIGYVWRGVLYVTEYHDPEDDDAPLCFCGAARPERCTCLPMADND